MGGCSAVGVSADTATTSFVYTIHTCPKFINVAPNVICCTQKYERFIFVFYSLLLLVSETKVHITKLEPKRENKNKNIDYKTCHLRRLESTMCTRFFLEEEFLY